MALERNVPQTWKSSCLMSRALILGTGYSLKAQANQIAAFDGLIFGPNHTYQDFPLDCWLACDPAYHAFYGLVSGDFDKWHWDKGICEEYGYKYTEGVWMDGLYMGPENKISLNHCSGAQLLNLAANQYGCDEIILVGHDFHYDAPQRHYFDDVSETPGEYAQPLRKHSKFIKPDGNDLLKVYKHIADQDGLPRIINCTPGSKLPWFEFGQLKDYLR